MGRKPRSQAGTRQGAEGSRRSSREHRNTLLVRERTVTLPILTTGRVVSRVLSGPPAHFLLREMLLQLLQAFLGGQVHETAKEIPELHPGVAQLVRQLPVRTERKQSARKPEQTQLLT